jgi:uncharacterized membrane protein YoaK (UPF0700 family)
VIEKEGIMTNELITPAPAGSPSAPEARVGDRSPRVRARNAEWLAAALAMIAGFVDAYGMITFGVYVSFMSGNTTQTGYQIAEGAYRPASLSALAILFFVVGSFAATLLAQSAGRHARRLVYGLVAAALAAIVGLTELGALPGSAAIASISCAMGIMNNALSRVGAQAVSVAFVTGALSRLGVSLALALRRAPLADSEGPWDTHLRRAVLLARLWVAFLAGALSSGAATPRYGALALAAPALVLAVLAAFAHPDGAAS